MKNFMLLLPILSGAFWGSSGIFVRKLNEFGFDDFTMIFIRVAIAVLLLFFGILIIDRSMLKVKLSDVWIFAVCGVFGILGLNLCYNRAMVELTMSLAAVLLSMSPLFVMVMAAIFLKEKITARKIVCTAMAVFGCVLVSGVLESGHGVTISLSGVLLGIAAAFLYALYSIVSKLATKRRYNVFVTTFYSMLTGAIVLLPFTNWDTIGRFAAAAPVGNTIFILINAIFTSILPYILYSVALAHMDAGKVSILGSGAEPSSAMLFGLIFFAEKPTVLALCGLAVTIVALWLLCKKPGSDRLPEVSGVTDREADGDTGGRIKAKRKTP